MQKQNSMDNKEVTQEEIAKAKELLAKEKEAKAQKFRDELKALCDKYECDLAQGQIMIIPR